LGTYGDACCQDSQTYQKMFLLHIGFLFLWY